MSHLHLSQAAVEGIGFGLVSIWLDNLFRGVVHEAWKHHAGIVKAVRKLEQAGGSVRGWIQEHLWMFDPLN